MGIKGLVVPVFWINERVPMRNIKVVIVYIMQKHVNTCEIISRKINFPDRRILFVRFPCQELWANLRRREPEPQAGSYTLFTSFFPIVVDLCKKLTYFLRRVEFATPIYQHWKHT